jgi:23S rRNA pseudouridine1911/1915/1917 synthase
VINKPAGLVVHPGTHGSHSDDSLVNAILHHCMGTLGGIGGTLRPGIVHRLDKDTSGLLVVAKNDKAQQFLMEQFQKKEVVKIYYALVVGRLEPEKGTIDAPIGRSLHDRKKMAVMENKTSKEAVTKYEVVRYLGDYTYVKVYLLTGRTHQIRVHFAAIGFPLVGDQTYGRIKVNNRFQQHYGLMRQFLHAAYLSFKLPDENNKKEEFTSTLPSDLQRVLDDLTKETKP